ncbi:MAG: PTS transporter subunit EIIB [Bacilli bacterium]|nr:PTS transporter subunit EIIB [Bacilli bacterium]
MDIYIQYTIIVVILVFIAIIAIKSSKKDFKVEANKLVELLGGKDNIIKMEVKHSRFKVTLKNVTLANKESIQKLGAKGIVEIDNQLKIIFDSDAAKLKKHIEDLKKNDAIK